MSMASSAAPSEKDKKEQAQSRKKLLDSFYISFSPKQDAKNINIYPFKENLKFVIGLLSKWDLSQDQTHDNGTREFLLTLNKKADSDPVQMAKQQFRWQFPSNPQYSHYSIRDDEIVGWLSERIGNLQTRLNRVLRENKDDDAPLILGQIANNDITSTFRTAYVKDLAMAQVNHKLDTEIKKAPTLPKADPKPGIKSNSITLYADYTAIAIEKFGEFKPDQVETNLKTLIATCKIMEDHVSDDKDQATAYQKLKELFEAISLFLGKFSPKNEDNKISDKEYTKLAGIVQISKVLINLTPEKIIDAGPKLITHLLIANLNAARVSVDEIWRPTGQVFKDGLRDIIKANKFELEVDKNHDSIKKWVHEIAKHKQALERKFKPADLQPKTPAPKATTATAAAVKAKDLKTPQPNLFTPQKKPPSTSGNIPPTPGSKLG